MGVEGLLQGRLRRIGLFVGAGLAVLLFFLVFMAGQFSGLSDINALDYAQIADNLAHGRGFTTYFLKPLSLARVHSKSLSEHPDLTYPPLHATWLSMLLRVAGDDVLSRDRAVALGSGIPFLLTIVVVFLLGDALFERRVAWLSAAMYATYLGPATYGTLHMAISGLEAPLLGLLVSLLLLVLYWIARAQKRQVAIAVLAGVLMALIYLTQYLWIVGLIPVLVYLWYSVEKRSRATVILAFMVAFIVVISPWLVRMQQVAGNPFFTFRWHEITGQTRTNPANTLYRTYADAVSSPISFLVHSPREMYEKLRAGVGEMYMTLTTLAGPYLTAFFIVAIIVPLGRSAFERVRYLTYALYGCVFIALAFVQASSRLLTPIAPIVTVISCGFFFRILQPRLEALPPREHRRYLTLAVGLLVAIHVFPTALAITLPSGRDEVRAQEQIAAWCADVAEYVDGPVVTDIPWMMAWYGRTPAVWLPRSLNDLHSLERDYKEARWVLLTPVVWNMRASERFEDWPLVWQEGIRRAAAGVPMQYEEYALRQAFAEGQWVLFEHVGPNPGSPPPPPGRAATRERDAGAPGRPS